MKHRQIALAISFSLTIILISILLFMGLNIVITLFISSIPALLYGFITGIHDYRSFFLKEIPLPVSDSKSSTESNASRTWPISLENQDMRVDSYHISWLTFHALSSARYTFNLLVDESEEKSSTDLPPFSYADSVSIASTHASA